MRVARRRKYLPDGSIAPTTSDARPASMSRCRASAIASDRNPCFAINADGSLCSSRDGSPISTRASGSASSGRADAARSGSTRTTSGLRAWSSIRATSVSGAAVMRPVSDMGLHFAPSSNSPCVVLSTLGSRTPYRMPAIKLKMMIATAEIVSHAITGCPGPVDEDAQGSARSGGERMGRDRRKRSRRPRFGEGLGRAGT